MSDDRVGGVRAGGGQAALIALIERLQRSPPESAAQSTTVDQAPAGGLEIGTASLGGNQFTQNLWSGALTAGWPEPARGQTRNLAVATPFGPSVPGGSASNDPIAKVMADGRVRLSESLAKTHGLDTEAAVSAACDPYVAELATRLGDPTYEALYDDALEARAEALDRVREREAERVAGELARALGAEAMADKVAPLKVRVPPGLQAMPVPQALGERAETLAQATIAVTSFLADLTPGVGGAKQLAEAVTGRDQAGFGKALSSGERALRAALVAVPAAGALLAGGVKGAQAVAQVAARTGRSASEVLAAVRTLRVLGPEAKALEGALAKRAAGQALTREEAVLLRRASAKVEGLRAGGPLRQAQKRAAQLDRVEAKAAARRGEGVAATEKNRPTSDLPHTKQTHDRSCGPACGEMASGHHAQTTPGAVATTEATLMKQPEFQNGMTPWELVPALERKAPVPGRTWQSIEVLPGLPLGARRTPEQIKGALETALREGNGVAIVTTAKRGADGEYLHWVVVRKVENGKVLIHDPEADMFLVEAITEKGFGDYRLMGDVVVAAPKAKKP